MWDSDRECPALGGAGEGGTVEVGDPMAGLPLPPVLLGNTTGLGLVAGGLSSRKEGTEVESAEEESEGEVAEGRGLRGWLLGLNEDGTSLAEEALRWSGCGW